MGLINVSGDPLTDVEGMGVTPDGRIYVTTGNNGSQLSQRNNLYEITMIQAGNVTASFILGFNPMSSPELSDIEAFSCYSIPVGAPPSARMPTNVPT